MRHFLAYNHGKYVAFYMENKQHCLGGGVGNAVFTVFIQNSKYFVTDCRCAKNYRKSPFIEKMTNFCIKWRKCEVLQHLGCWNLVCSIILGCYKKYMRGFWNFWFFGHFSGVKVQFWPFLTKNHISTLQKWPKNQNVQNPRIYFL